MRTLKTRWKIRWDFPMRRANALRERARISSAKINAVQKKRKKNNLPLLFCFCIVFFFSYSIFVPNHYGDNFAFFWGFENSNASICPYPKQSEIRDLRGFLLNVCFRLRNMVFENLSYIIFQGINKSPKKVGFSFLCFLWFTTKQHRYLRYRHAHVSPTAKNFRIFHGSIVSYGCL